MPLAALPLALVGCLSSNIDDAGFTSQPLPQQPSAVSATSPASAFDAIDPTPAAIDPNADYPNINEVPQGATAQLTPEDEFRVRAEANASAAQQSNISPAETAAYAAELKRLKLLAQQHAKKTRQEIEGK